MEPFRAAYQILRQSQKHTLLLARTTYIYFFRVNVWKCGCACANTGQFGALTNYSNYRFTQIKYKYNK